MYFRGFCFRAFDRYREEEERGIDARGAVFVVVSGERFRFYYFMPNYSIFFSPLFFSHAVLKVTFPPFSSPYFVFLSRGLSSAAGLPTAGGNFQFIAGAGKATEPFPHTKTRHGYFLLLYFPYFRCVDLRLPPSVNQFVVLVYFDLDDFYSLGGDAISPDGKNCAQTVRKMRLNKRFDNEIQRLHLGSGEVFMRTFG